jgi:hypothetical protein
VLFAGFVGYALSGYVVVVWRWFARRRRPLPSAPPQ